MKNTTLRIRPVANGQNEHIYYFVNENQWLETENLPMKRKSIKAVKIDFINKIITPPIKLKNILPFVNIAKFSTSEQRFISMRIDLNFSNDVISEMVVKPLNI